MTNSAGTDVAARAIVREPRPFLFLEPARGTPDANPDTIDLERLEAAAGGAISTLVRSLVNFTIAVQNRRALERGRPQPIQLSVLNRRRRAARAWLLAVVAGRADAGTCHAVATQWLPTLAGTGPELARAREHAAAIVEFVRGAITALIFDEPSPSLLRHARALHVLETTLAVHLAAVQHAGCTPTRG